MVGVCWLLPRDLVVSCWSFRRPPGRMSPQSVLPGVLCAASLAARDLVTWRIPATIPSSTIAIATTLAVCLAGLLGLVERWTTLTRA